MGLKVQTVHLFLLQHSLMSMLGVLKRVFWPKESQEPLAVREKVTKFQNVKAEDYATPDKYLEGAEIPTYYQFQSNLVQDEDLKPGMPRNFEVDKRLTLPTRTHIRLLCTAQDVLHAFAVPSLGLKCDCCPGRLNKLSTFIQREGFIMAIARNCVGHCTVSCLLWWRLCRQRRMQRMHRNGTRNE